MTWSIAQWEERHDTEKLNTSTAYEVQYFVPDSVKHCQRLVL